MKIEKTIIVLIIVILFLIGFLSIIIFMINKNSENDEIALQDDGGVEYDVSQLNNFDMEVKDIPNDIKNEIKYDKFYISLKEYMYKNGFVDADLLKCINSKKEGNIIELKFRLNNKKQTIITANIDIVNFNYEFSDDY